MLLLLGLTPEKAAEYRSDPKFIEFMSMHLRRKNKFWDNDDNTVKIAMKNVNVNETYEQYKAEMKKKSKDIDSDSDDDDYDNNPIIDNTTKTNDETKEIEEIEEDKTLVLNNAVSDLDYLKAKKGNFSDDSDDEMEDKKISNTDTKSKNGEKKSKTNTKTNKKSKQSDDDSSSDSDSDSEEKTTFSSAPLTLLPPVQIQSTLTPPPLSETGRLYVRSLPYSVTEDELKTLFEPFGIIASIHIPQKKGTAYIEYTLPSNSESAMNKLNNTHFQGRPLLILPSYPKPIEKQKKLLSTMNDNEKSNLTYKQRKELEIKEKAENTNNWNTLFINADTVTNATAAKYGIEKSDIFNREIDNMAVRQTLSETQLINETKTFLSENNINIELFNTNKATCKRSNTVIIVKNISFATTEDELRKKFNMGPGKKKLNFFKRNYFFLFVFLFFRF
jgi:multiple RNA-binding domain-containing protein 1